MPDYREPAAADEAGHASVEQLADLLEGELPVGQAETVTAHMSACPRCAALRDQLGALPQLLSATSVPPLPPAVAARLDAVVAAESARRAAGARQPDTGRQGDEQPDVETVLVPLSRLRRDRVRHWLAGAVTAAAVVLAISVVPDLVGGVGGSADEAASSGADAGGLSDGARGAAPEAAGSLQQTTPDLDSDEFAAGVELLHDSGAQAYRALSGSRPDAPAATDHGLGARSACTTGPSDSVPGTVDALVRVDGELAQLAASGPVAKRRVEAYSCRTGNRLATADVDLTR